jgi:transposase
MFCRHLSRVVASVDTRGVLELRHMSISEHKHVLDAAPAQRIELFTGTGRRRTWSGEEKAAIVAESYVDGVKACQVARRHGLTPQQLFGWRREARAGAAEPSSPLFVPAMIEAAPLEKAPERDSLRGAAIELEIDGVTVRVGLGAEAKIVTAVIRALKAGA